ncbi:DUF6528 family protein [Pedobacter heparinus]|uniref:DUF6528 family protein n=1 Tax=Pedobacter heparinus TaxID=984 RepID=UPI00292F7A5F|nr:DUF6528 family protein [Pedobacter heparinus]
MKKYISYFLMAVLCILSCKTEPLNSPGEAKESIASKESIMALESTINPFIAIGNAENKTLEVYHWWNTNWTPSTAYWVWTPTTAQGFSSTGIANFDGPYDHKVRYVDGFPGKATSAVGIVGHRWLGIVAYDGTYARGQKLWGTYWSAAQDPSVHGCELLPNGNLAVASPGNTDTGYGAWVRIYDTSDVNVGNDFVSISLPSARAVSWDPVNSLLWTAGRDDSDGKYYIMAFTTGTRTNPQLIEQTSRRMEAPGQYPHDISPYYGDTNKLWYADHSGLYIYNKTTKQFLPATGASNRAQLKAAGNQDGDGGYLVETKADPTGCGTYCTKKVEFYNPGTGVLEFTRTASHARIYRARVFTRPYN